MPDWQNTTGPEGDLLGICVHFCPSFIVDLQPGLRYYKHLLGIVTEENVGEGEGVGVRKKEFLQSEWENS